LLLPTALPTGAGIVCIVSFCLYSSVLFGKDKENGTKKPSAKPEKCLPRVKV
jgi:hypothetical protein